MFLSFLISDLCYCESLEVYVPCFKFIWFGFLFVFFVWLGLFCAAAGKLQQVNKRSCFCLSQSHFVYVLTLNIHVVIVVGIFMYC